MGVNLPQLLNDYKVPFITSGAEVTRGWIGMCCPWCGDSSNHLGYSSAKNLLTCWRCGPKRMVPTLKLMLNLPAPEIERILKNYGIVSSDQDYQQETFHNQKLILPAEFGALEARHKQYLLRRGFNWKELVARWGLMGTTKCIGYANRIIIPIYFNGRLVSFQSRAISDDVDLPKKACEMSKEVVHFKDCLYGYDRVKGNTVIVTEGPFDVFRFGYGAVCTFGIKFNERQVDLLSTFKNVFIVFDSADTEDGKEEKQAQEQAEKLANKLSIFQNTWIITDLGSDPGKMKQQKANRIKRRILDIAERYNLNRG